MKTKSKSNRSKQFNSRLVAYSATAGVALMAAPAAQATIQNITTFSYDYGTSFTTTQPDVTANPANGSAETVFTGATAGHARAFFGALAVVRGQSSNGASGGLAGIQMTARAGVVAGSISSHGIVGVAKDLIFGASIAGATHFVPGAIAAMKNLGPQGLGPGSFLPSGNNTAKTGYIGFKSGSYYGWLRVKVVNDSSGLPSEITLAGKDGIYGAIGGKGDDITAGETAGMSSVPDQASTLELSGLALLALGAFGVREQHRRRQPTDPH